MARRSLKYECVYLRAFAGGREARQGIGDWIVFYNHRRPHGAHGGEPRSGYIGKGCRLPARAYAGTSSREPWWHNQRNGIPTGRPRL